MAYKNVLEVIGHTPEVKINRLFGNDANVFIKLERLNPGGSIKDRIALAMVEDAEAKGILKKDSVIVEPESMSIERRKLVAAYGAEVVLTPKEKGTGGAVAKALEIAEGKPNYWVPQQFKNPANPDVHEKTTAQEILKSFPEGFDYFVTGVGTGGHISGVSKVLKQHFPNLKTVAVEPDQSAVLSGGAPGPHALQGLGTGFIPDNYNPAVVDEVIPISKEEAFDYARRLAKEEGILGGISTGAALAAVAKVLKRDPKARVLTVNYDTGERYWSVEGLF